MVEWKKLGEVCCIRTGKLNANAQVENGKYPFFTCDAKPFRIDTFAFDTEAILISGNGSQVGHLNYYKGKFNAYQRTYVIDYFRDVNVFYLFHYLKSTIRPYVMDKSKKGSVPYITLPILEGFIIPIPSLEEQTRIVGILDTFTASIDNLKEQIAQRRKQYEYYRDQLYYPSKEALQKAAEDRKVEVKIFDEIGSFTRGRRFVRTDIVPEGVPCIHYGDMYTYFGISADITPTHLTKETAAKLRFANKGDIVIVAAGENDLDIGVGVAWLGDEDVVVHDACFIFKHDMNPKYISHYLRSRNYHQQIRMGVVDGKICSISAKELGRTLIAVPNLQEQRRIATILDTFESSIQNLEAQLSQREKQYEYYRNKLLTFE